jgi:polysaccharide deacetylase family protein (PEP-CTERM system associated)
LGHIDTAYKKSKKLVRDFQDNYYGFRAPFFSIKKENLWTLDVLKEEGFIYDSSIFSGNTFRSGIKGFEKKIHILPNGLIEFPITNFSLMNFDMGSGGAYYRILPYNYFKKKLKQIINEQHALFYFHPWELDEKQPYIKGLNSRAVYTHYFNLSQTKRKLERLLNDFEFHSLQDILALL